MTCVFMARKGINLWW